MRRLFSGLALVLALTAIYVLFTGVATELTIVSGLFVSALLTIAIDRLTGGRGLRFGDLLKAVYVVKYAALFVAIELKEHLKMVGIALRGDGRVNPEVVEVPIDVGPEWGVALLALTITSIPGTIAIHFDRSRRVLYVHWLTARRGSVEEVKREVLGDFEKLVKKIFG